MTFRRGRWAIASIAFALHACTNDYGQFDFPGGTGGSSHAGEAGSEMQSGGSDSGEDANARGGSSESYDAPSEMPAEAGDAVAEPDAAPGEADAPLEVGDESLETQDAMSESGDGPPSPVDADASDDGTSDSESDGGALVDAGIDASEDDARVDEPEPDGDAVPDATDAQALDVSVDAGLEANADGPTEAEAAMSCSSGTKACGSACVSVNDPSTGCAGSSCAPCTLPHAVTTCVAGACALSTCGAGFENCDGVAANGCEAELSSDGDNCGECGRACSPYGALSRQCTAGVCVSSCVIGHENCSRPLSGGDDGCEMPDDNANCGSCGNDCGKQGTGLVCGAAAAGQCGCRTDSDCKVMSAEGTCDVASGVCSCGGVACRPGEACQRNGPPTMDECSCNGGAACSAGETCCFAPAGCKDLANNPASCGACGRTCPSGLFCVAGVCRCFNDAECDAGSPGTCAVGQCVCGATTCAPGQRCQPDGTCG